MTSSISTTVLNIANLNTEASSFKYTEENITKAISLVESKYNTPSKLNYHIVGTIGKSEYDQISTKLSSLTETIDKMKTPGISYLLDELQKDISNSNLDDIWNRACAVKPSLWSRVISKFGSNKSALNSVQEQHNSLFTQLKSNTGSLNAKVHSLKTELYSKRSEQMTCVEILQQSFGVYLDQLTELGVQYLVAGTVKVKQQEYVDSFKSLDTLTPAEHKELINAESVLSSLINRELVLHNSINQVPIIVKQYEIMINSCNNALQEIDNTLDGTFNSIKSNINTLSIAMKSQQALTSNNSTQTLNDNLTKLSQRVVGDIAVKTATLSSDNRLKEANQLQESITCILRLKDDLAIANAKQKQQYQEATDKMNEVSRLINQELVNK